ncbi:MAG: molybdopterin-dependent oxidoreductase [Candidatus Acidiferrum sp.]|jgi:hypothetical protein
MLICCAIRGMLSFVILRRHKLDLIPIALFATVCFACTVQAQQPAAPPAVAAPSDQLRISAYTKHEDLVLKAADFKALPHISITVHNEHANADETYSGVRVSDLLAKLGAPLGRDLRGAALGGYIVATGSDGYVAVFALAEVDTTFHSGEVIVADSMNGQPLDPKTGAFRLVVSEDKRPARWVRNLVSIELKSAK